MDMVRHSFFAASLRILVEEEIYIPDDIDPMLALLVSVVWEFSSL